MMNYFDKNKILTAAVVLLLLINLGILGLLWFDRTHKLRAPDKMQTDEMRNPPDGRPPEDRLPPERGPKEFLIRELGFNENQKNEYVKLVEEHQKEMRRLSDKIKREKDKLWNILSGPLTDTSSAGTTASEIGSDQKEIEMVTFRHFQKVKELCNEDQKKKFDEVIKEALKMMRPNMPPRDQH